MYYYGKYFEIMILFIQYDCKYSEGLLLQLMCFCGYGSDFRMN